MNSPIDNIKKAITRLQEEQLTVNNEMEKEINKEEESCNINYVKLLIERQKVINKDIKKITDGLVKLYEQEVEKLVERSDAAGLSETLKKVIYDELDYFKTMLNLGLSTNTEIEIDGSSFSTLSTSLHEKCPLLFEVVECLLLTSSRGKLQTGQRIHM